MTEGLRMYSMEEIQSHNTNESLWIVMNDKVYDLTKFINDHPGGEDPLLQNAGEDATEAFKDVGHSLDAREMAKEYFIGILKNKNK